MACGVPVVASAHASLDKACGDAAVRADPARPEELARGIERAVRERDELVRRGLKHARTFTWQRVGRTFLEGFEAVA
jgi:glycosyltransferase involved in cell wall biosynthesis